MTPDDPDPRPWEPDLHGAFLIVLEGDEPTAVVHFARNRGADERDIWTLDEVGRRREVDPVVHPIGWIEPDGRFGFFHLGPFDEAARPRLADFVRRSDDRLVHDEAFPPEWDFSS